MFLLGKALWFLLTPSNSLTLLALCGIAAALVARGSRKALAVAAFGALGLALCGVSPIGFWLATPLETRFAPPRPMPREVAGFIVLGGGLRLYDTDQTDALSVNDSGDRLIALADLARRYPSAKIVMSGGSGDLFDEGVAESDLVRRHAETLGIDPSRVLAENRSRTTYENALYTRELVQPADGETWLLVTSAWHMPRAVGAFRQAGFPVTAYPVDFRSPGPRFSWRAFSEVARGLRLTDIMAKEWVGLLAYRLTGRTDALLPGPDRG
jgi:uncharacterized SAM-binding protein YcdF (DUF218 family)